MCEGLLLHRNRWRYFQDQLITEFIMKVFCWTALATLGLLKTLTLPCKQKNRKKFLPLIQKKSGPNYPWSLMKHPLVYCGLIVWLPVQQLWLKTMNGYLKRTKNILSEIVNHDYRLGLQWPGRESTMNNNPCSHFRQESLSGAFG